jgi:hypothetical protein
VSSENFRKKLDELNKAGEALARAIQPNTFEKANLGTSIRARSTQDALMQEKKLSPHSTRRNGVCLSELHLIGN